MASNPAIELASTIQSASINRAPSPTHDLNPSTAASQKIPVTVDETTTSSTTAHPNNNTDPSLSQYIYETSEGEHEVDIDDIDLDDDEDEAPGIVRPLPRRKSFGPLPDLRFEQSYLRSIEGASSNWGVAAITIRDQLLLPLLQGTIWSLMLFGWRHWNNSAQLSGSSVGAKVRRWWYRTNNWKLPSKAQVRLGREQLAKDMTDFYQNKNASD